MNTINANTPPGFSRTGTPRAAKVMLKAGACFLTFANPETDVVQIRYAVIGTDYGWLHNSAGDIRFWKSASGARRAAKQYAASR